MKRFPFILVLIITVLSGCSNTDNLSFDTVQSRVIGKWTIHKVKLLDNRRLFSSNITDIYKDFTFEYKADNTLEVFNARENKLLQGIWYLDEIWSWDEENQQNESSYKIYSLVSDPTDSSAYREMYWSDLRVNNRTMHITESRLSDDAQTHKYSYELRR